jgi:hypothetical protein
MADKYTRNHRGKIIEIMGLLEGKEGLMNFSGEVPSDISDDHFTSFDHYAIENTGDTPAASWQMVPRVCMSPLDESPAKSARCRDDLSTADMDLDGQDELGDILDEDEEEEIWYETRTLLLKSLQGTKFPASKLLQHLDGPLSLVKTKIPSGPLKTKKVHLALTTRITVGCGMKATKCDVITANETIPLQATLETIQGQLDPRICARCFKFFYWDLPHDEALLSDTTYEETQETIDSGNSDSDSMPSASGDSSTSNDSESEMEALRPP